RSAAGSWRHWNRASGSGPPHTACRSPSPTSPDAPGPFTGALKRVIGNEPAGEIGLLASDEGVVVMQLKRPLPNLGDVGVVDLDLVGRVRRDRSSGEQDRRK